MQACVTNMFRSEYRLPLQGWQVISIIGRFEPVSAKEVRLRTQLPADQVSRILDRLVRRGWVKRKRDGDDGRRLALSLLPSGRRVFERADFVIRAINREMLRSFSIRERKVLETMIGRLEQRSRDLLPSPKAWREIAAKRR